MIEAIKARVVGGWKTSLQGAVEGTAFAAAIPILDLDVSKPEGKLSALIAIWRVVYGLFKK
jgi:hypothetical protein